MRDGWLRIRVAAGRDRFRRQRGFSFTELLGVLAISMVALLVSLTVSHEWIKRQAARSAVYEIQSHLKLAQTHAITLTKDCAFIVNDATRLVQIFDTVNNLELFSVTLSPTITFDRPDAGPPITIKPLSGNRWTTVYSPQGSIVDGPGHIAVRGGDGYHRIVVYPAGGVAVERWNGTGWTIN